MHKEQLPLTLGTPKTFMDLMMEYCCPNPAHYAHRFDIIKLGEVPYLEVEHLSFDDIFNSP